jgi:hypothetical protein
MPDAKTRKCKKKDKMETIKKETGGKENRKADI